MEAIQNYILILRLWRKKKIVKQFRKYIDLQSQIIYVDKKKFKKNLHILEDGASGVQVVIVEKCLLKKNWLNYIEFMILYQKKGWWPQIHNEFKRIWTWKSGSK